MATGDQAATSRAGQTNRLATAALVCGILQFCGLLPAGIAAIILGHIANRQIRRTCERGRGQAKAGLILGYIGTGLLIVALVGLGV